MTFLKECGRKRIIEGQVILASLVLLVISSSACGTQMSVSFRPAKAKTFPPHRGGVALYTGDRQPRVPHDDVGSIEVISEGQPSSDAMEAMLRDKARTVGATAVLNVRWYADVLEDDMVVRETLRDAACLSDWRFCLFMNDRQRSVERVVLVGYAVRARR